MADTAAKSMSVEAFLAWEQEQPTRFEFVDGQPMAMTGGTIAHDDVRGNIFAAFRNALKSRQCRAQLDVKVVCGSGNLRYPDVQIRCGRNLPTDQVAAEPTVVVEVLSPSTRAADFLVKFADYDTVPSISTYLISWQDAAKVVVFRRTAGGRLAPADEHKGLVATIDLPEFGISLRLADVYDGVDFPEPATVSAPNPVP